jgi:hypothetical protein
MHHFTIFAHGKEFDPDACLRDSSLEFDRSWHLGDPRGCADFFQDEHPTSGIEIVLGNGRELTIDEQDRIARDFLEEHENALAQLSKYPGVDTFILGLHYRIPHTPGLRGFCMSASARLMYFALRTGVDVTFYGSFGKKCPTC